MCGHTLFVLINLSCFQVVLQAFYSILSAYSPHVVPNEHSEIRKKYPPLLLILPPGAVIINMRWLYCAAGGRGRLLLQRGQMHTSMDTSCDALMHLRALTSIKRDNGQLSCTSQANNTPLGTEVLWSSFFYHLHNAHLLFIYFKII